MSELFSDITRYRVDFCQDKVTFFQMIFASMGLLSTLEGENDQILKWYFL